MLTASRCAICATPLDVHQAVRGALCARPACLRARLQIEERHRRAAERERSEAAARAWLAAAPAALRADAAAAAVVLVPANAQRVTALPAARRRAFAAHLRAVIDQALAQPPPRRRAQRPPEPGAVAPGHPVLADACATCRGRCCVQGGTHAFVDTDTIHRLIAERGLRDPRAIARAYLRHLPARTYADSCVFQAADGCALPRPIRADICNWFYCAPLKTRWTTLTERSAQPLALVAADDGVPRRVTLRHGDRSQPLRRPRPTRP